MYVLQNSYETVQTDASVHLLGSFPLELSRKKKTKVARPPVIYLPWHGICLVVHMIAWRCCNANANIQSMMISTASGNANHSKSPVRLSLSFQGAEVPKPSITNTKFDNLRGHKPTTETATPCYFSAKLDTNLKPGWSTARNQQGTPRE